MLYRKCKHRKNIGLEPPQKKVHNDSLFFGVTLFRFFCYNVSRYSIVEVFHCRPPPFFQHNCVLVWPGKIEVVCQFECLFAKICSLNTTLMVHVQLKVANDKPTWSIQRDTNGANCNGQLPSANMKRSSFRGFFWDRPILGSNAHSFCLRHPITW